MFQYVVDFLSSAYIELVILILFVAYFVLHRRDRRMVISAVRILRMAIVVTVFIYFMFIWASTVQPTLRSISIFGMFLINLYMGYSLLLSRLEGPYRDALNAIGHDPDQHDTVHDIWRLGKRFFYVRYAFSSLFSGANPVKFLHDVAIDRVREDIKSELHRYGVEKKLISLDEMTAYLKDKAACDANLPVDFKELMEKTVDDFAKHPWIQEQVNNFLTLATESPEDLHFPEWMSKFEACVTEYKE
jgi:hypothetical protein